MKLQEITAPIIRIKHDFVPTEICKLIHSYCCIQPSDMPYTIWSHEDDDYVSFKGHQYVKTYYMLKLNDDASFILKIVFWAGCNWSMINRN